MAMGIAKSLTRESGADGMDIYKKAKDRRVSVLCLYIFIPLYIRTEEEKKKKLCVSVSLCSKKKDSVPHGFLNLKP